MLIVNEALVAFDRHTASFTNNQKKNAPGSEAEGDVKGRQLRAKRLLSRLQKERAIACPGSRTCLAAGAASELDFVTAHYESTLRASNGVKRAS